MRTSRTRTWTVRPEEANLDDADLTGADLTAASLFQTQTTGTNFTDVVWNETICPDGTLSNDDGSTCVNNLAFSP